jgi:UPF0755 protein
MSKILELLILLILSTNHLSSKELRKVVILPGENAYRIAIKLRDAGIINNPNTFILFSRLLGYDKKFKAGNYKFCPDERYLKIFRTLSENSERRVLITIPEGYTIKQIGELLEREGICSKDKFYTATKDIEFIRSLKVPQNYLEGYLFPDSYDFLFSSDPKEIISQMVNRFWEIISELTPVKNLARIDTVVKIASLIEKEAKLSDERPIIASVFYNRLKRKMPLQSCATIQYILPVSKEILSIEETKIPSPYNTYRYSGLPPTPICNPGKESLRAALYPRKTDYLYFAVDKNGAHHFSKTFKEHEEFIARRRKNNNIH